MCKRPALQNMTKHYNKAIYPKQHSLFFKAVVLLAGRLKSASCCNETPSGCLVSKHIFQNQNWPDIFFFSFNKHTTKSALYLLMALQCEVLGLLGHVHVCLSVCPSLPVCMSVCQYSARFSERNSSLLWPY